MTNPEISYFQPAPGDRTLALCPFCGRRPVLTVRPDNAEATSYFAAVACFCDGYAACAHKDATAAEADEAERLVRAKWNSRAIPAPEGGPQRLPLAQATAPRKIWLQSSGVEFDMAEPFPDNHEGITWCEDEIGDGDVPYVRADLAAQPQRAPVPDLYDRLAEAHDASLDDDHRACRVILTECMSLLAHPRPSPAEGDKVGRDALAKLIPQDIWHGWPMNNVERVLDCMVLAANPQPKGTVPAEELEVAFAVGELTPSEQHALWLEAKPQPSHKTAASDLVWQIGSFALKLMAAVKQRVAQAPAPGAQSQEAQNAAWRKWDDTGTIGSLIAFLATLDPSEPIVTAYHIALGSGERRCKTQRLTISRERVDHTTNTIRTADKSLPYTHVLWAHPPEAIPAPAVAAWQPIETAPKDGTAVLIGRAGLPESSVSYPHEKGYVKLRSWKLGGGASVQWDVAPLSPPTHYKPLPPQPSVQHQEQQP